MYSDASLYSGANWGAYGEEKEEENAGSSTWGYTSKILWQNCNSHHY
jgi:hypothetical protein